MTSPGIVVLPKEPHPYQESLYREIRRLGAEARYAGALTPSRTLNLVLLPLELLWRRVRGARILHVHWVYFFQFPGAGRHPVLRRLAQWWFALVLGTASLAGLRVVWTAHNVLPHDRVFWDDVAARRRLLEASDLVIAHTSAAVQGVQEQIGPVAHKVRTIPLGPSAPFSGVDAGALRPPGAGEGPRVALFMGRIQEYKGVEDLLAAMALLPAGTPLRLVVTGRCQDASLRARLERAAALGGHSVDLRIGQVPDDEITQLIASADVVILPFRRLTTSSSALDAMAHGRVVVVPDLPAFDEIPADALVRYPGGVDELVRVLEAVASADAGALAAQGRRAAAYAGRFSWHTAAEETLDAIRSLEPALCDAANPPREAPLGSAR